MSRPVIDNMFARLGAAQNENDDKHKLLPDMCMHLRKSISQNYN